MSEIFDGQRRRFWVLNESGGYRELPHEQEPDLRARKPQLEQFDSETGTWKPI